jgi:hypothetical protein
LSRNNSGGSATDTLSKILLHELYPKRLLKELVGNEIAGVHLASLRKVCTNC